MWSHTQLRCTMTRHLFYAARRSRVSREVRRLRPDRARVILLRGGFLASRSSPPPREIVPHGRCLASVALVLSLGHVREALVESEVGGDETPPERARGPRSSEASGRAVGDDAGVSRLGDERASGAVGVDVDDGVVPASRAIVDAGEEREESRRAEFVVASFVYGPGQSFRARTTRPQSWTTSGRRRISKAASALAVATSVTVSAWISGTDRSTPSEHVAAVRQGGGSEDRGPG